MIQATPTSENKWRGSVNYNGGAYSGSVKLINANAMKLSGCQGIFCQSMQFTRL